jgi:hypothetical protein
MLVIPEGVAEAEGFFWRDTDNFLWFLMVATVISPINSSRRQLFRSRQLS